LTNNSQFASCSDHVYNILLVCGMSDKKLQQKIAPIQALSVVKEVFLVRKVPFEGDKIRCFTVPRLFRSFKPLLELWRFFAVVYICLRYHPDVGVGMTLIGHCFHIHAAKKLFGVPSVFHIMGKQDLQLHNPRRKRLQRFMWRFACKADVLVLRGHNTKKSFIEKGGFPAERIFVQQNVFDMKRYQTNRDI